jgi:hypothetical protein
MLIFQMFPAVLSLVALYALFDRLGQYIPFVGLNTHGGVIFAYMGGIALHVWTIKGYFETIDGSLEEAAALDGATPWQAFRLVLLPLSVPILAVVFILSFIAAITEVPVASLLLRDVNSYTLAVGMQQYLNPQNYLWGDFAAAAVLSAIPITVVPAGAALAGERPDGGRGERLSFCNTGPKFQRRADGLAAIHDPNRVLSPSPSAEKVRPMPLLSSTGPYINSICDCWSAALEAAFLFAFQAIRVTQPERNHQNQDRGGINKHRHRRLMVDDDQTHNRGDADIDKIAQREMEPRLKILDDQRDKLEVEKVDHQPFHQPVLTGRLRGKQDIGQMQRLFTEEDDQDNPQAQQPKIQNRLHRSGDKIHQWAINRRHIHTS